VIYDACKSSPTTKDVILDVIRLTRVLKKFLIEVNYKPKVSDVISQIKLAQEEDIQEGDIVLEILKGTPAAADIILDLYKAVSYEEFVSIWDHAFSNMTREQTFKLLGIEVKEEVTDTEENIYKDEAPMEYIMNELIRQEYLANPAVDNTGPFLYDYEPDTAVRNTDKEGNIIFSAGDANSEDNLDIYDRNKYTGNEGE
ncbi:MAG: hypothetical protein NC489_38885, partial [Ruminococcus flavefaciens]|nr:hypothetical protein [Ruminococcus flavefaciens]